jgi:FAD synthetase
LSKLDPKRDEAKAEIKQLYLLQLRKGHFTTREYALARGLSEEDAGGELNSIRAQGMITSASVGTEHSFALTREARGKITVVLAGGVYDVLHLGHVTSLEEAAQLGDVLIVVVATDVTVESFKGRKPIFPEEDRRALVEALKHVDRAILGYEDVGTGYEQILSEVQPDIIALGYDQDLLAKTVQEIVQKRRMNARIVRLTKYDKEKFISSTSVRQKILEDSE